MPVNVFLKVLEGFAKCSGAVQCSGEAQGRDTVTWDPWGSVENMRKEMARVTPVDGMSDWLNAASGQDFSPLAFAQGCRRVRGLG